MIGKIRPKSERKLHVRSQSSDFVFKSSSLTAKRPQKLTILRKIPDNEERSNSRISPSQQAKSIKDILYIPQFIKDRNSPNKQFTDFTALNKKLAKDPMQDKSIFKFGNKTGVTATQPMQTLKELVNFSSPHNSRQYIASSTRLAKKQIPKQKSVLYTGKMTAKNTDFNRWALMKDRVLSQPTSPVKNKSIFQRSSDLSNQHDTKTKKLVLMLPSEIKEISAEPSFFEAPSKINKAKAMYSQPFRFNHHERSKSEFSKQLLENLLKQQDIDIIKTFYKKLYNTKERDYKQKVKNTLGGPSMYSVKSRKQKTPVNQIKENSPKKTENLKDNQSMTDSYIDILVEREGRVYYDEIKQKLSKKRPRINPRNRLAEAMQSNWGNPSSPTAIKHHQASIKLQADCDRDRTYIDVRDFRDQLLAIENIKIDTLRMTNNV
jgi:hypothetical protein